MTTPVASNDVPSAIIIHSDQTTSSLYYRSYQYVKNEPGYKKDNERIGCEIRKLYIGFVVNGLFAIVTGVIGLGAVKDYINPLYSAIPAITTYVGLAEVLYAKCAPRVVVGYTDARGFLYHPKNEKRFARVNFSFGITITVIFTLLATAAVVYAIMKAFFIPQLP